MAIFNFAARAPQPTGREVVDVLRRIGTSEPTLPLTAKDIAAGNQMFRASMLAKLCAREEVLAAIGGVPRTRVIEASLRAILDTGSALHDMTRGYLASAGVLAGAWECARCHETRGGKTGKYPGRRLMPPSCSSCGAKDFQFVEEFAFDPEYLVGGSCDGFLYFGPKIQSPHVDPDGNVVPVDAILEAKSVTANGTGDIRKAPYRDHALQAQIYLWLFGVPSARILYIIKDFAAARRVVRDLAVPFIEHTVPRSDSDINELKAKASSILIGVKNDVAPERTVCKTRHDQRARDCVLAERCFA